MKKEVAVFGMGCFWGPQKMFDHTKGVLKTEVGFMGGKIDNPSYKRVCQGDTGHVEVTKIEFDSDIINYEKLLDIFWKNHDPTQRNRQGFDFGSQYRSVIFYFDESQRELAENSKKKYQKKLSKDIATEIVPAGKFFKAEEYHQKYLEKTGLNVC